VHAVGFHATTVWPTGWGELLIIGVVMGLLGDWESAFAFRRWVVPDVSIAWLW